MALTKKLMAGGLAALALMATAGTAIAAPAFATGNVNVRSGPGTYYSVVDVLRRGERVDVERCRGSWCFVEKRGPDGWVSSSFLSRGGRPGWYDDDWDRPPHWNPRPPRRPHWDPRPRHPQFPHNPGARFCINGPHGYFCIGN